MAGSISYTLKISSKARRMRLAVYCSGAVVVTAPRRMDLSLVERFVTEKATWLAKKIEYFKNIPKTNIPLSKDDLSRYKLQAHELATARLEYFNQFYGFKYKRVCIKSQKTKWGSCSSKGNLNFNFKIALLTPEQADYIIVHELCHLGELNHSRRFWDLVRKTIPNYKQIKLELRRSGLMINH